MPACGTGAQPLDQPGVLTATIVSLLLSMPRKPRKPRFSFFPTLTFAAAEKLEYRVEHGDDAECLKVLGELRGHISHELTMLSLNGHVSYVHDAEPSDGDIFLKGEEEAYEEAQAELGRHHYWTLSLETREDDDSIGQCISSEPEEELREAFLSFFHVLLRCPPSFWIPYKHT